MNLKITYLFLFVLMSISFHELNAQNTTNFTPGITFKPNTLHLQQAVAKNKSAKGKLTNQSITLPLLDGTQKTFTLKENNLSEVKLSQITTFDGTSTDGTAKLKLNVTESGITGIVKTSEGYAIFEPYLTSPGEYRLYNSFEMFGNSFKCGADEKEFKNNVISIANKLSKTSAVANFPFGSTLRTFRMAVATTGEFTNLAGSQDLAIAEVNKMMNLINMIFESELSMTFQLIAETTNKTLIFTDANTDPFTVDTNFANANNSQAGFTTLRNNGTLTEDKYDIGHTFHMLPAVNGWSAAGQAGPQPCGANQKARAWSQWTKTTSLSGIANLIVHEMGHQFSAWHTYNAVGGNDGSNFCVNGWRSDTAVEPGSGTTIMGYGNNCNTPVDYRNTSPNGHNYFHAKSVDQILNNLAVSASCYVSTAKTNTPPTANAGNVTITIPKDTPFKLKGIGSDAESAVSYTWEQNDLATTTGKGAFGSTIAGADGKTAVQSTTAPLFRSEQSTSTPERVFPKMKFVLNNSNVPPTVNEAEALPQVARDMNFRFTVRDLNGGMNSDNILVKVADNGPLKVTSPNTAVALNSGDTVNITWDVNNTNAIAANVNILLSTDGGQNFNIVLAQNTSNDGTESIVIPSMPNTSKARVKVVAVINEYAEFFDVSDIDFSIASSCTAYSSIINDTTPAVTALKGDAATNLNLKTEGPADQTFTEKVFIFSSANLTTNPIIVLNNAQNGPRTFSNGRISTVTKFKVTATGNYTITRTNTPSIFYIMSIFNGSTISAANFVHSNTHDNGTNFTSYSSFTTTLEKGKEYTLITNNGQTTANDSSHAVSFYGPGTLYDLVTPPAGVNYTYTAVNTLTQKVVATNATADFRTLAEGVYKVYGVSYTGNESNLLNKTFSELSLGGTCYQQSNNAIDLTITGPTLATSETSKNAITLAPNPVKDLLKISTSHPITHVEIYDISGKYIDQVDAKTKEVNFAKYKTGVYLIRVFNNQSLIHQGKVIKN